MKTFFNERRRSAGYARDRMKLLLISERIECSPQMMKMLKSDLVHTIPAAGAPGHRCHSCSHQPRSATDSTAQFYAACAYF